MDARRFLLWLALGAPAVADPPRTAPASHAARLLARPTPRPTYVSTGGFVLGFDCAEETSIDHVRVWLSSDAGSTWSECSATRVGARGVRCAVSSDGVYDCYLVLENAAGRSAPPPTPGASAHARFVVDTQPPTLQVHEALCRRSGADGRVLRLRISLVEENLAEDGVRLLYRTRSDGAWLDGGGVQIIDGFLSWPVPPLVGDRIDVRLAVTDRAGNRCDDELPAVNCAVPGSLARATHTASTPPSADRTISATLSGPGAPNPAPASAPAAPSAAPLAAAASAGAAAQPLAGRAATLRQQAAEFVLDGQFTLAAARLEDALEQMPDQPELLTDLGDVLLKLRRPEQAEQRFRAAVAIDAGLLRAREGLALAALAEKRYADARRELQVWVARDAGAARAWLRLGDVEYKLGETTSALASWQRAAQSAGDDADLGARARQRVTLFGPPSTTISEPRP